MSSRYIIFSLVMMLALPVMADKRDTEATIRWLEDGEATVDYGGWVGDYFFLYFVPEGNGYINSIDFNISDVPDVSGAALSMRTFTIDYLNWTEIPTSLIADSCGAGHLGYYDEDTGFETFGTNWVQGGINQSEWADPEFDYDPLDSQWFPAFGAASMGLEPTEDDSGLFRMEWLYDGSSQYLFQSGVPLAIVVRLVGLENTDASLEELRFGFAAAEIEHDPQPGLKFFGTYSSPVGPCGMNDWGWYVTSYVWDWRVNVAYTADVNSEFPATPTDFNLQVYPSPFNPSTTIQYTLEKANPVSLNIYNLLGQLVHTQDLGLQQPGPHSLSWDGLEHPSGVYIIELRSGTQSARQKVVLLR